MMTRTLVATIVLLGLVPTSGRADMRTVDTEHLRIMWEEGRATEAAVAMAEKEGERFHAAIARLLGHEPAARIVIVLEGPAERPDGSRGYPHVDSWGRIHLYRFGPTHHGYFSALAHEMVHVFRIHRLPHHDWFFEEGFAELVALEVDESLAGFPWYGFPPTIAAGQWLAAGEVIPLRLLRERHRELNMPCKAQSYTLRSAFFAFLGHDYGVEAVVAFAAENEAGADDGYGRHFGKDFDELAAEWEAALMREYRGIADAEDQARRYRLETPIQYMPVCSEGEDF